MKPRTTTTLLCFLLLALPKVYAAETLTIWAMGAEGKLIRQLADRFERLHPDLTVLTQPIPWSGAHEKLITAVVGDIPPDICQLGTTWMAEFIAMDALEPLDRYLGQSVSIKLNDFFASSLLSATKNDAIYALPWYVDTRVVFYRNDLVEAAGFSTFPTNWEGFYGLTRKLQEQKRQQEQPGYALSLPVKDWQTFLPFFWQNGGKITPDGISFATTSTSETVGYYKRFFDEGMAPLEAAADIDLFNAFAKGYYPIFISGPWQVAELLGSYPQLNGKWRTSPLPGKRNNSSFSGGANLVVFANSPHKQLAWNFLEYVGSAEIQAYWYRISGNLPANRRAWLDKSIEGNEHLKAFKSQLEHVRTIPLLPEWEAMATAIEDELETIIYGKVTVDEGLEAIDRKLNRIISARTERESPVMIATSFIVLIGAFMIAIFLIIRRMKSAKIESGRRGAALIAFAFLSPALAILSVFLIVPIIASFLMSMTNWNIYTINEMSRLNFIGLANYHELLFDPLFWMSLRTTLLFTVLGVPLNILLALGSALVLNQGFIRIKVVFRTGFFIPVITTLVAAAIVWRWLYNPDLGLINRFLAVLSLPGYNWLSDTALALPALVLMAVWKGFGYNMIIFIAALQAIPNDLYEAAEIDGAMPGQKLINITLPMIAKAIFFVSLMTTIGNLQFFAEPYVMTKGGPLNSTMSVVLYMYNHGFKFYNLGYATAIAYCLFLLIALISFLQLRFSKGMAR